MFSREHYWRSTNGWLFIFSPPCKGCNEDRLGMVFSNRIQQVSYDNFIIVIRAFCLQPTQNRSALRESRERKRWGAEGGGRSERAKERDRESRHTINPKERHPWGIQSADFSGGGGDPILDSPFFLPKGQLLAFMKANHVCPFGFLETPQGAVIFGKGSSRFQGQD